MAGNLRKPLSKNEPIPFTIEADGQSHTGTLTPSGKPLQLGTPNAFVVRMDGSPPVTISIYMGRWVMHAKDSIIKALGDFIEAYYK